MHLVNPPLAKVAELDLPKNSVYHYYDGSAAQKGPPSDELVFRHVSKQIPIAHLSELLNKPIKGFPRKQPIALTTEIRQYHLKNRRFMKMISYEASARDPNTVIVYNYAMINLMYRYQRSLFREYFRSQNLIETVFANIGELAKSNVREHFIPVRLPEILPSVSVLNTVSSAPMTQKMVKIFNNLETLMLLEIWKWLGPARSTSCIAKLNPEAISRINLIYQESGVWFALNLGVLDRWRVEGDEDEEVEEVIVDKKNKSTVDLIKITNQGVKPRQLQRLFLRLMMSLAHEHTSSNIGVIADEEEVDTTEAGVLKAHKEVEEQDQGMRVITQSDKVLVDPVTGAVSSATGEGSLKLTKPKGFDEPDDKFYMPDPKLMLQVDKDLEVLEELTKRIIDSIDSEEEGGPPKVEVPQMLETLTLEQSVMAICNEHADRGSMSAAEYRRFQKLAASYKSIPAPDGVSTLEEFIKIAPEQLEIKSSAQMVDIPTVLDKTMLKSSLLDFDSRYIKEVLQKDIANMAMSVQNAGIAVTNYEVETHEDAISAYNIHTVRVVPVEGAQSTLRFRIPVMSEDGTYRSNDVKYRMRKQRGDMPIRKTAPDRVALTSYYGKSFIHRSTKRVNDYGRWLTDAIMAKGLDNEDKSVTELQPGDAFDNHFKCPRLYSILAMQFRGFTLTWDGHIDEAVGNNQFELFFDHSKREAVFGKDVLKMYEKEGRIVFGKSSSDNYLVMDAHGVIYAAKAGFLKEFQPIEVLLGLDSSKAPVDFVELKVMGKNIPLGVVLAYKVGFEKLVALLKVSPRRVAAGQRLNMNPHEYSIAFGDETLIFSKDDQLASLIFAGFNEYHRSIRNFNSYEFDKPGVYLNILESSGLSTRYIREMDLLYQMFIDPITRDLLVEMKEPTNFRDLLIRAAQLLMHDQHLEENDAREQRMKGNERLAGAVYYEIVKALRNHNAQPGKAKAPIDMSPFAVWTAIATDPSVTTVSDINPIQNLREGEAVTYTGLLGRTGRSITKKVRAYHDNDMGTMSEATSDSSDVGINTHTSADPQFKSLRGTSRPYVLGETGATALLSTAALLAPSADHDDPKRVNFIGIQQRHGIACDGYTQSPVRTGYEGVLAQRTTDMFAAAAKKAGIVRSVSEEGLLIEYADGEKVGYPIGRRFGSSEGLIIPHSVVTKLKEGDKVKPGEIISYNDGFFEPDMLNPDNVIWKAGAIVRTVLWESTDTLEDSSAISGEVAELLKTRATKVKTVVVRFDQAISRMVKVGQAVEPESILCIIEDAVTANAKLFDEDDLDTLRIFSQQTPQAKMRGVVERIEVFYHAIDTEDMSASLKEIAKTSDREMAKRNKAVGKRIFTGSVDEGFRVDGNPLVMDTMAIRIYITGDVAAAQGDKGVFANQLKTVFGRVMPNTTRTASGKKIGAIFGRKSIADRIVLSADDTGTTITLLDVVAEGAVEIYKS